MKLTELIQFLIIGIGIIPIAIIFYGYRGYQTILSKNPCEMTYSYPFHYDMKLEWKKENFRLMKVSANANDNDLHAHPVLFIPGHKGSHQQVRSFASDMHNDDSYYQYFTIDFNQDIVGLHGKDLLLKAAFVNEALRTIRKLYSNKPDVKVTLLAHSYGGMIAKTSVLLSNHPNCIVESIFMLGTPNLRPVHGFDASLTSLFTQVNKGYYSAFYSNSSCGHYNISAKYATTRVQFQPSCTACVKNITMVVISGGDIDLEVSPEATNIFDIAAHPRNISSLPVNKKGGFILSRLLSSFSDLRVSLFRNVYGYIFGASKPSSGVSTSANSTLTSEFDINGTVTVQEEVEIEPAIPENSTYHFITRDLWAETILTYHEPRHMSYRTSQLSKVGFPMDHYALLWCRELLSEVTSAMRKVTKRKETPLHSLFDIHDRDTIISAMKEVNVLKIKELTHYVGRNMSNRSWLKAGIEIDQKDMLNRIDGNTLQLFAINYFLRHWQDCFFFTLALIIFSLSMKILAILTALENRIPSNLNSIFANYTTDFEVLILFFKRFYKLIQENQAFYVLFGIFSVLLYYLRQFFFTSVINFHASSLSIVHSILGLMLGFTIRSIIFTGIRIFRAILNVVLKRTKKQPVTEEGEGGGEEEEGNNSNNKKKNLNLIQRLFGKWVWRYFNELFIFSAWLTVYIVFHTASSVPTTWLLIFCSLSVVLYVVIVLEFIYLSLITTKNHFYNSKRGNAAPGTVIPEYIDEEIVFIVFWILFTALPSFKFCAEITLITKTSLKYETALYEILTPDHIQYLLILIFTHFLVRKLTSKKRVINIQPMASLLTLLDKPIKKTGCVHEDGGVNAIFEEVANDNNQLVGKHLICIGTTYRVIWCNCRENRNFKTTDEWCEWCKCSKCNPAGSYGYQQPPKGNTFTINLDLALGLVLLAISGYMVLFVRDEFYTSLYSAAYVCTAIVFRTFWTKRTIDLTM